MISFMVTMDNSFTNILRRKKEKRNESFRPVVSFVQLAR